MAKKTPNAPPDTERARTDAADAALARGEAPKDTRTDAEKKSDKRAAALDPDAGKTFHGPADAVSAAARPEAVVNQESVHVIVDTPINTVVAPAELVEAPAEWEPPPGHIVSDEKTYYLRVDGQRFVHVGDAPDGRWVYRAD
jgi:hypothetical protein